MTAFEKLLQNLALETARQKLEAVKAEREREELMLEMLGQGFEQEYGAAALKRARNRLRLQRIATRQACYGCGGQIDGEPKMVDGLPFHDGCAERVGVKS